MKNILTSAFIILHFLVMEQTHATKDHRHAIFIARGNDIFIAIRAARLQHIFHAAASRTIDRIAEREEGIRAQHYFGHTVPPLTSFFGCQLAWRFYEPIPPLGSLPSRP